MPSKPRPKTFVAVVDFAAVGERYAAGDVVPAGPGLRAALSHGDTFVTAQRNNTRKKPSKPVEPIEPELKETPQ